VPGHVYAGIKCTAPCVLYWLLGINLSVILSLYLLTKSGIIMENCLGLPHSFQPDSKIVPQISSWLIPCAVIVLY
jgi:hypothetical protein